MEQSSKLFTEVKVSQQVKDKVKRLYHETDYGIRKKMKSKIQNLIDGKGIRDWYELESVVGLNLNKFIRMHKGKAQYRIPLTFFNLLDPIACKIAFNYRNITTGVYTPGNRELLEDICEDVGVDIQSILKSIEGDITTL